MLVFPAQSWIAIEVCIGGNPSVTMCALTSLNVGATGCGEKLLDTFFCWKSAAGTNAMLRGALQLFIKLGIPF